MAFQQPLDIANRALQHCGLRRAYQLTDAAPGAAEINFCYDDIRLAELRRNLWTFATRRVILRPVGLDSVIWTPPAWVSGTSYSAGAVTRYAPTSGPYNGVTLYWALSVAEASSTTAPDTNTLWHLYTGPVAIDLFDSEQTYSAGEVVLVPTVYAAGTTYAVNNVVSYNSVWYVSLAGGNIGNTPSSSAAYWELWSDGRSDGSFGKTADDSPIPVTYSSGYSVYISLFNSNTDNPLSGATNWLSVAGTIAPLRLVWPIGSGPAIENGTNNAYHLPNGFLKRAPTDPRAGQLSWLGAGTGPSPEDWVLEDSYLISGCTGTLMLRFIANILDVNLMDPMFCEGVAARIALEVIPSLVEKDQWTARAANARERYKTSMYEARIANAIEVGPVSLPESLYITVRR